MPPIETYIHADYEDFAAALAAVGPTLTKVLEPWGFYNRELDHVPVALPGFTVPSELSVVCPVALSQTPFTITVDAAPRTLVTGDSPAAGQVGVDWVSGRLTFHSSDDGKTAVVSLTPRESAVMAAFLHWLQAELMATQQGQLVGTRRILSTVTGLDLKAAGATTTLLSAAATELYEIGCVRVRANTITGPITTWPEVRIETAGGLLVFPARELLNLDTSQASWTFEGPGLRRYLDGDAEGVLRGYVETPAAAASFTADFEIEGVRRA
jgi:hypothetical protein